MKKRRSSKKQKKYYLEPGFSDLDWNDVLFVGLDRVRELIRDEARRKRLIQLSASAKPFGLYDGESITPDEFVKMMDF